jgi:hypothetical protein
VEMYSSTTFEKVEPLTRGLGFKQFAAEERWD